MRCNLTQYGVLTVAGLHAEKLLQGQLTCDVLQLAEDHTTMGAQCNRQGRVISLFYLVKKNAHFYLIMPRALIPITLKALQKYAVFYKVTLTDESEAFTLIGTKVSQEILPTIELENVPLFIPLGSREQVAGRRDSFTDWHIALLQAKIPTLYPETSEQFLPHELGLQNLQAIHFDKGCYTGQEIIARMHYRGKLKKHLAYRVLSSNEAPQPGAPLFCARDTETLQVGHVIDIALLSENQYGALVLLDDAANLTPSDHLTTSTSEISS